MSAGRTDRDNRRSVIREEGLYIHGQCHIGSPTWAIYHGDLAALMVICATCRKEIATFKLAPKPDVSLKAQERLARLESTTKRSAL